MASYQVMCSVTRPAEPAALCHVDQFPVKIQRHMGSVLQDVILTATDGENSCGSSHIQLGGGVDGGGNGEQPRGDNLLCALVSKTSVSFSEEEKFSSASKVKMPFFWCDLCPFDTESKPSLLNHIVTHHLFVCRFCTYVALSRCDVVQHGLSQHPLSFQQFCDQRLKGCFLKRQAFQQQFQPESAPLHIIQLCGDTDVEEDAEMGKKGNESSKNNLELNAELQDDGVGYSSGSDSCDNKINEHFQQQMPLGRDAGLQPASVDGKAESAESVGENVVSSSGMEPDSGVSASESVSTTTIDSLGMAASGFSHSQEALTMIINIKSPETFLTSSPMSDTLILPDVPIKKETDTEMEGFNIALGRTAANHTEGCQRGDKSSSVDAAGGNTASLRTVIKKEHADNWNEKRMFSHVNSLVRSSSSSPLPIICAENLQRQFEESFQIQSSSSLSTPAEGLPSRHVPSECDVSSPSLVENFLLDSSDSGPRKSAASGDSTPSMLRSLLTQPRLQSGNLIEAQADYILAKSPSKGCAGSEGTADNFLLSPLKYNGCKLKESDDFRDENISPILKQEPVECDGALSHALVSSFCGAVVDENVSNKSVSHVAKVNKEVQSPAAKNPLPQIHSMSPRISTEKLKSYSNMSLRDILTMNTELDIIAPPLCSRDTFTGNYSLRDMKAYDKYNNYMMQNKDNEDSAAENSLVMWECGYCDFMARSRTVVMAHRQQMHSNLMAEAGFANCDDEFNHREEEDEDDRDDEWLNLGAEEEEGDGNWRDQPSTSEGRGSASLSFTFKDAESQKQLNKHRYDGQRSANRNNRVRSARHDEDFEYLSPESPAESQSDEEPGEDLKDKNYEPPKHMILEDPESSDDEQPRRSSTSGTPRRKRGRPPGSKNRPRATLHLKPLEKKDKDLENLYQCPYCSHYPTSVQELKNHIRHVGTSKEPNSKDTTSNRHLLMVNRMMRDYSQWRKRGKLHYICPNDDCTGVFPELPSGLYLSHVLECQGFVLDAQETSVRAMAAKALKGAIDDAVAGFINCPVYKCYFVIPSHDQMDAHLGVHIQHIHSAQCLLFSTICSALAKSFGEVDGFDRFICYRCASILSSLPDAVHHMHKDHSDMVRGVLRIFQRHDDVCRGIMVSIYCLGCLQGMPTLNHWFIHRCSAEGEVGERDNFVPAYSYAPVVPALDRWVWRIQYKFNNPIHVSTQPQANRLDGGSQSGVKLSLIRSILERTGAPTTTKEALQQLEQRQSEVEEDEVMPVVQCLECNDFVPEDTWKQHGCTVRAMKAKQGPFSDLKPPSDSQKATTIETAACTVTGEGKDSPHSRLLSALASRHQNDLLASSASSTCMTACSSHPTSSGNSSLLSLLTSPRSSSSLSCQSLPQYLSKGGAPRPPTSSPMSNSLLKDNTGSTIRSLLTGPLFVDVEKTRSLSGRKRRKSSSDGRQTFSKDTLELSPVSSESHRKNKFQLSKDFPSVSLEQHQQKFIGSTGGKDCRADTKTGEPAKRRKNGVVIGEDVVQHTPLGLPGGNSSSGRPAQNKSQVPAPQLLQGLSVDVSDKGEKSELDITSPPQGPPSQGFLMTFLHQQGNQMMQVLGNVLDDHPENL